jgi:hypothetical protein
MATEMEGMYLTRASSDASDCVYRGITGARLKVLDRQI